MPVIGNGPSSQGLTVQRGRGCPCSHTWDPGALSPQRGGDSVLFLQKGFYQLNVCAGHGHMEESESNSLSLPLLAFPAPCAKETLFPKEVSCAFQISKSNSLGLSFHYIQVTVK